MSSKSKRHANNGPWTGTTNRMQTLPHINISSIEHHQNINHPLIPSSDEVKQEKQEEFINESSNRKCVYTYEDKYTFARILTNDSLVFDSHFESGNLHSAFRVQNNAQTSKSQVYDLYLHNDVNTTGHTQWFYFSVSNCKAGQDVTFVIRNFSKPDSLYGDGMRPLLYSVRSCRGWERCGTSICYFSGNQNSSRHYINSDRKDGLESVDTKKKLVVTNPYIMCFTHIFEFSGDVCYFAYCQPYTYTDLQRYLDKASLDVNTSKRFRRNVLCKTNAGNNCDLLTITAPAKSAEEITKRVTVVLTSRVHPGESNSSWIMQGILDVLLGNSKEAQALREKFIFKVIPMLNPDGVINGNYRTSLSGCDLNRRWNNPDPIEHPTIFYAKELIKRLTKTRTVGLMMDIHGHSQRQGVFIYGCVPDKRILRPPSPQIIYSNDKSSMAFDYSSFMKDDNKRQLNVSNNSSESNFPKSNSSRRDVVAWRVRLLPRIFDATIPIFSFDSCSFKMHRAKASTMRMVAFAELGVDCVYTIEASLAGKEPFHFSAHDLLQLGREITLGILAAYPSMAPKNSTFDNILASPNNGLIALNQHSINILQSLKYEIQRKSPVSPSNLSFSNNLIGFYDEMLAWRKLYDPSVSIGKFIISEFGMYDLYGDSLNDQKANENGIDTPTSMPLPPQYKSDSNSNNLINKSNYDDNNNSTNNNTYIDKKISSKKSFQSKSKKSNDDKEKESYNDKDKTIPKSVEIPRPPSNQQKQSKPKKHRKHDVITTKVEKPISKIGIIQSNDNINNQLNPDNIMIIVNNINSNTNTTTNNISSSIMNQDDKIRRSRRKSTTSNDVRKSSPLLIPTIPIIIANDTKQLINASDETIIKQTDSDRIDPFKNLRLLSQQTQHVALEEVQFQQKNNETSYSNDSNQIRILPTKYLSSSNINNNLYSDNSPGIVIDSTSQTQINIKNKQNAWIITDSNQRNTNNDIDKSIEKKLSIIRTKRQYIQSDDTVIDNTDSQLFIQSKPLLQNKSSDSNRSYKIMNKLQINNIPSSMDDNYNNNVEAIKIVDNEINKIDEDSNVSLVKFIMDSVASVKGHKIIGKVHLNDKTTELTNQSQQILTNSSRQIRTAMNVFNDGQQSREFSNDRNAENTIRVSKTNFIA